MNGVESTGFLGLSPVQRQALGWLALEGQALPNGNICTVTRVAPRWALTAAHCFHPAPDSIVAVFETGETVVDLRDVVIHPNRDLALLPLGVTGPHLPWVEHLPLQVHDRVEVGGYGVDEAGRTGHLAFGVAVVASLAEHDVVTARTNSGAPCNGDSGGPLLVRAADGHVSTAGVLSAGSPTCTGSDRYERTDRAAEWLQAVVGTESASPAPAACDALGAWGRCFGELVVWCENGVEQARTCGDGTSCGWDERAFGYRCVRSDPCLGVSDVGECSGSIARRCQEGTLTELDCSACGGSCGVSGRTGEVVCSQRRSR